MMLMRDRSGRSGRRRGSQKPGTASGSAGVAAAAGGAGGCFVACASGAVAVSAASIVAKVHVVPTRQHALFSLIRRSLTQNCGDHSIAVGSGESKIAGLLWADAPM